MCPNPPKVPKLNNLELEMDSDGDVTDETSDSETEDAEDDLAFETELELLRQQNFVLELEKLRVLNEMERVEEKNRELCNILLLDQNIIEDLQLQLTKPMEEVNSLATSEQHEERKNEEKSGNLHENNI